MQRGYRESDILRRLSISKLMLTVYLAGFNVFTTGIEELKEAPALFLPSNRRGHGTNLWANARIAGVGALGDTAYAVHYVRPGIGKILLSDELATFTRNISPLRAASQAFIFCGDSYGELLSELEREEDPDMGRLVSYGGACLRICSPVTIQGRCSCVSWAGQATGRN